VCSSHDREDNSRERGWGCVIMVRCYVRTFHRLHLFEHLQFLFIVKRIYYLLFTIKYIILLNKDFDGVLNDRFNTINFGQPVDRYALNTILSTKTGSNQDGP
jgi:hypothetical protein